MTRGDEQATGRPIDILLVEDSPTDRLMTVAALDQSRVLNSLHTVENGVDALAFLRRQGVFRDAPRPDLILLDLNLPKMDGREVLAEIKRDRVLRYIPVIVLTTSKSDDDVRRAYGEHANGYICKPIDLTQLAHALESAGHYWFQVVMLPDLAVLRTSRNMTPSPDVLATSSGGPHVEQADPSFLPRREEG